MDILRTKKYKKKEHIIIKSIIFKTIVDLFFQIKGIYISQDIISIKLFNKKITINTNKSILAYELSLMNDLITLDLEKKFANISYNNVFDEISYR